MRPVPNVVWPPPASLTCYSDSESFSGHVFSMLSLQSNDSESLSGHVFSMLSLQSNSGAGQKRPQAGHDVSVKSAI